MRCAREEDERLRGMRRTSRQPRPQWFTQLLQSTAPSGQLEMLHSRARQPHRVQVHKHLVLVP